MGRRSVRVTGPDGKKRVTRGGVYIPGFVQRMQMESRLDGAPAKVKHTFPARLRESSQELSSSNNSEPGSLIGGISSSGIRAYTQVSTISDQEMSEEERRKKMAASRARYLALQREQRVAAPNGDEPSGPHR